MPILPPPLSLTRSLPPFHTPHTPHTHTARIPTIATCVPRAGFAWVTRKLKEEKVLSIPLCTTNRINMPATAEAVLAEGSAVGGV